MIRRIINIDISEQLIKFGYFPEQLPPCFSTESLFNSYSSLLAVKKDSNSECTTFTLSKNNSGRRMMRIPNPEHQIRLIEYILKNQLEIKSWCARSEYTLSNPFKAKNDIYSEGFLDIPRLRDKFDFPSAFLTNLRNKIRISLGYRFVYKVDLSSFYDSIYTHTIEWATKGRDQAKLDFFNHHHSADLGENLDKLVRNTNSLETAGIPTGPYTSRIISEILLVAVDEKLADLGLLFRRYVDDYEFYFKSEDELLRKQGPISNVFSSFRLKINEQKTSINVYPYHFTENFKETYSGLIARYKESASQEEKKNSLMFMFFKADSLFASGQIGAYKYLLKLIKNEDFSDVWSFMEAFLVNMILIKPQLTEYVFPIVVNHVEWITSKFKKGLVENLISSVSNCYHNEAQWLFWILRKICYTFSEDELNAILVTNDDILKIFVIDYVSEFMSNSHCLTNYIAEIYLEYSQYSFRSEHWLFAYTCFEQKWFDYEILTKVITSNEFASAMLDSGVSFFISPSCKAES